MKRFIIALMLVVAFAGAAKAQFSYVGFRVAGGIATLQDDLTEKTPILGASAGIYVNYDFSRLRSVMSQIFYLQSGVNLTRRGGTYYEKFAVGEKISSEHEVTMDAWYVQVPLLANFRFELPAKTRRQYVRLFVGPAISVGVFGSYNDMQTTPRLPQREVNHKIRNAAAFDYMNRIDADLMVGIGYEYNRFTISFYVDHGFLSSVDERDVLRTIENQGNEVTHGGCNMTAYMLSASYRLPLNANKDPRRR